MLQLLSSARASAGPRQHPAHCPAWNVPRQQGHLVNAAEHNQHWRAPHPCQAFGSSRQSLREPPAHSYPCCFHPAPPIVTRPLPHRSIPERILEDTVQQVPLTQCGCLDQNTGLCLPAQAHTWILSGPRSTGFRSPVDSRPPCAVPKKPAASVATDRWAGQQHSNHHRP